MQSMKTIDRQWTSRVTSRPDMSCTYAVHWLQHQPESCLWDGDVDRPPLAVASGRSFSSLHASQLNALPSVQPSLENWLGTLRQGPPLCVIIHCAGFP